MRTLGRLATTATVLLAFGLLMAMCGRVAARGRFAAPYSTLNAGPEGTKALFDLLSRLQATRRSIAAEPTRWMKDYGALPADAMLVTMADCQVSEEDLTRLASQDLARWVRRGGTLFVAGAGKILPRELGVSIDYHEDDCDLWARLGGLDETDGENEEQDSSGGFESFEGEFPRALRAGNDPPAIGEAPNADSDEGKARTLRWTEPLPELQNELAPIPMRAPAFIRTAERHDAEILLQHEGYPMLLTFPEGEGRVIVAASASFLQNRDIDFADGAVLFDRLVRSYAPGRPILFNERHLGIGSERSFLQYARDTGAGPFLLMLAIVMLLGMWRLGARIGEPRDEPTLKAGGTASYVDAIAILYRRCGDPAGVLAIVVRRALQQIAAHHHLASSDAGHIQAALHSRSRTQAAEAVAKLSTIEAARPAKVRELTGFAREIDSLIRIALDEENMTQ